MKPVGDLPLGRYRRRILGWGAVVVVGIFAGGAAVAIPQVEDDLEARVVAEFNEAGVGPVTVSFDGQAGTLSCNSGPVPIPDDLLERSRSLWGVDSLDVDPSCDSAAGPTTSTVPAPESTAAPETFASPTTTVPATTTTVAPDADDIGTVIANDSQFSTLDGLIGDAGLDETVATTEPLTFFAPTNEAFQALGPDIVAELGRDPDLLRTVLEHHLAAAVLGTSDIADGAIEMLDATVVGAATTGGTITLTSGAAVAMIVEADLVASNGVVHAIDAVLLPADVEVGARAAEPLVTARLSDGQFVLTGEVASQQQLDLVLAAARSAVAEENVLNDLTVDPNGVVGDTEVNRLAALMAPLPSQLAEGEVSITGAGMAIRGTYFDEAARDTVLAAAAGIETLDNSTVVVELEARRVADGDSAAAVEADLAALVATTPILFESAGAEISADSAALLDRVAAVVNRVAGLTVEIRGYTDTDGTAVNNQALSEARAQAVLQALVDRGVPASILSAVGFGGTVPVLDADGVEDKAASRRVEFAVTVP